MLKDRLSAVENVRADLRDMETAADNAAVALFSGIANMILQRRQAGLPFETASAALVRMSDAAATQLRANATLAEAHREMAVIPAHIGLRAWYGDVMPCEPDEQKRRNNGSGLHVVRDSASA